MELPPLIIRSRLGPAENAFRQLREALAALEHTQTRMDTEWSEKRLSLANRLRSLRIRLQKRFAVLICERLLLLDIEARSYMEQLENTFRAEALTLVKSICEQVLQTELLQSPEAVRARVENALQCLSARTLQVKVFSHPDDVSALQATLSGSTKREVFSSSRVKRGNAVLEVPFGRIELNWEKELSRVISRLAETVPS